jgi:hypothetical protein
VWPFAFLQWAAALPVFVLPVYLIVLVFSLLARAFEWELVDTATRLALYLAAAYGASAFIGGFGNGITRRNRHEILLNAGFAREDIQLLEQVIKREVGTLSATEQDMSLASAHRSWCMSFPLPTPSALADQLAVGACRRREHGDSESRHEDGAAPHIRPD